MKNVVLGSSGQLGRDLCTRLTGTVLPLTRADADLTKTSQIAQILQSQQPDIVVNCAAYNFVDLAEEEPDLAFANNEWAVQTLAQECSRLNATFVHFGTDHVFGRDSSRTTPWLETDEAGPVSVYGKSKLNGESRALLQCEKHFVIRTCGLYGVWGSGGKGGNFVETMLKLGKAGKTVRVVNDQTCTPTYTVDLADAVTRLIGTDQFGLYHLTNSGCCTWYEFAKTIFEMTNLEVELIPITTEEFGAKADRPRYSVLSNSKYESLGFPPLPDWRDALSRYLKERQQHE